MARKELNHRIQFLDGVFRLTETSSNDVTRVISEIDIRDAESKAGMSVAKAIEQMQVPPEQKMMFQLMLSDPETLLRYGCDITVTGWFNLPDPPDEFVEPGDPDPGGGIEMRTYEEQQAITIGGVRVQVGLKQTVPAV